MAIYDCLAVSVAGAGAEGPQILKEYVLEQGGTPECAVPGTGFRTTAALSALLTGTMAHVHDYDDCSYTMRGHPSAVYVPAIWALGGKFNISGRKAIEAYLCAFEVVSRIGLFTQAGPPMANAWHQTKMLGGIGSAADRAKIWT
jgi:2-methylcitrate dehydratase PrpD